MFPFKTFTVAFLLTLLVLSCSRQHKIKIGEKTVKKEILIRGYIDDKKFSHYIFTEIARVELNVPPYMDTIQHWIDQSEYGPGWSEVRNRITSRKKCCLQEFGFFVKELNPFKYFDCSDSILRITIEAHINSSPPLRSNEFMADLVSRYLDVYEKKILMYYYNIEEFNNREWIILNYDLQRKSRKYQTRTLEAITLFHKHLIFIKFECSQKNCDDLTPFAVSILKTVVLKDVGKVSEKEKAETLKIEKSFP